MHIMIYTTIGHSKNNDTYRATVGTYENGIKPIGYFHTRSRYALKSLERVIDRTEASIETLVNVGREQPIRIEKKRDLLDIEDGTRITA